MRVAHILRKYNPAEWGGTETALERLFEGLHPHVTPIIYCPRLQKNGHSNGVARQHNGGESNGVRDPFAERGYPIRRFRACVPIWGISKQRREQMISVGGNILSFDLITALWREPDLAVVHSHALGRLGGTALTIARKRHLPFVVTIHGGFLDLPEALRRRMNEPEFEGVEWGRAFGALLNSRRVVPEADAILTCNAREAALLRERFPGKRIHVQAHGVPIKLFEQDHRQTALAAFPQIAGKQLILLVGRVDPVKNQGWVLERAPSILLKHPEAVIVFAGACTDAEYGRALRDRVQELGLTNKVLLPGGFSSGEARLIGLMQQASVVVLPSISETFGLVVLEAWAAGAPVISSRTSGASALIEHGRNGWLFDLADPHGFHEALDAVLSNAKAGRAAAEEGRALALEKYDTRVIADQVRALYEDLAGLRPNPSPRGKEHAISCAT